MENQLLERLKGLPFHYEMNCYEKMAEVDTYERGVEIGAESALSGMNMRIKGATLEECVIKAFGILGMNYDDECLQVFNSEILISRMENDDGYNASPDEIKRWTLGKMRLWSVTYHWLVSLCIDGLGDELLEEELKTA